MVTEQEKSILSEDLIENIIKSPKFISKKIDFEDIPHSEDNCHLTRTFKLNCERFDCRMMIRQNTKKPENFSVILIYKDSNGNEHAVLRLNGNHGTHRNRLEKTSVKGPHIHLMTERYQKRTTHPDGFAVETDEYTDLESAIMVFMRMANIQYSDNRVEVTEECT